MLKIYLTENKGQEVVEQEVLNNKFKGFVLNSIFNFLEINEQDKKHIKANLLNNDQWGQFLQKYNEQILELDNYIKELR